MREEKEEEKREPEKVKKRNQTVPISHIQTQIETIKLHRIKREKYYYCGMRNQSGCI